MAGRGSARIGIEAGEPPRARISADFPIVSWK